MAAQSGWRPPRAQLNAALTLGLVTGGDAMTDEATSRLHWIYEVAYHAGYVHTSEDHELIQRAAELSGGTARTDTEIIANWCGALDALFAHGVEHALLPGADPAPLDFDGIGNFPAFKPLEQHRTATADILSAANGPAVSLTPLGAWAVIQQLGAKTEVLPESAELTPRQLIICRLGMLGEAFERELRAWLAARERAGAVSALLEAAADEEHLTGVQIAAGIGGRHRRRPALGDVGARHLALNGRGTKPAGRAGCAARPTAWPRATRMRCRGHDLAGYRGRLCDRRLWPHRSGGPPRRVRRPSCSSRCGAPATPISRL